MPTHRRGRPPKRKEITIKSAETRIFVGIVFVLAGLLCLLSPFMTGTVFSFILRLTGIGTFSAGIAMALLGIAILGYQGVFNSTRTIVGFIALTVLISAVGHFIIPIEQSGAEAALGNGGGYLGHFTVSFMIETFGRLASVIILVIWAIISFSLISNITLDQIKEAIAAKASRRKLGPEPLPDNELPELGDQALYVGQGSHIGQQSDKDENLEAADEHLASDMHHADSHTLDFAGRSSLDDIQAADDELEGPHYPNWAPPPSDMLSISQKITVDPSIYKQKADIIERTLKSFGIHAKVSEISVGPRVVQYALSITVGTKVSKVKALGNDLALALAAPSGSVRIEAPIPGTSHIGIEVPNQKPVFVTLGDMFGSQEMKDFRGQIPLLLGKNIAGVPIIRDLTRMPHLLVAGATGSGKSIWINAFLCSVLMTYSPDYVKFILVDPKMVELPPYNNIPHLLTPVITDVDKVIYSLEWLVVEMQRRFRILNKGGVKNLEQYNTSLGYPALPYIILVVDEMADLMLTAGVDVETKVVRLAQMARAVGIHLVLATQRPSVDILTGLIKANIPARIGMNVATSVDSRVILDMIGAETLLGDGDMLFKAPDTSRPVRLQGPFVSNKEIDQITSYLKSKTENIEYDPAITKPQQTTNGAVNSGGLSDDPLFADAVRVVVAAQKASSSLLQRKMRIGYNRAARLVDELYAAKVVGQQDGSKPRKVLISDADMFLNRVTGQEDE
jgi:DNA segregation ATPase FtsK/SpoIIIE, S-DNA-T family